MLKLANNAALKKLQLYPGEGLKSVSLTYGLENSRSLVRSPALPIIFPNIDDKSLRQDSFLSHRCPLFRQWLCEKAASGLEGILRGVMVKRTPGKYG